MRFALLVLAFFAAPLHAGDNLLIDPLPAPRTAICLSYMDGYRRALDRKLPLIIHVGKVRPDVLAEAPNWVHCDTRTWPQWDGVGIVTCRVYTTGAIRVQTEFRGEPKARDVVASIQGEPAFGRRLADPRQDAVGTPREGRTPAAAGEFRARTVTVERQQSTSRGYSSGYSRTRTAGRSGSC